MGAQTVYLDWSTLCDAFKATEGLAGSRPELRRLRAIVESLASTGKLHLSPTHISELLIWRPEQTALHMAQWLDSLRPRWVQACDPSNDEELRWWLNDELRLEQLSSFTPFVANMPRAFAHWAGSPHNPTIEGFVRYAYEHSSVPESRDHALQCFQHLHADRASVAGEFSQGDVERVLRIKFQALLIQRAQTLNLYHPNGARVSDAELIGLVSRVVEREDSVPFSRLASTLVRNLAQDIAVQQSDSAGFRKRYLSMSYDLQHLLGAAYCDVFTCDRRVDHAIGDFRKRRGRKPQLSLGGNLGAEEFVHTLQQQISE